MRNLSDDNGNFDLSLIMVIVFWVGISGFISTLIQWYIDVVDGHNNYKLKLILYILVAILGLIIIYIFFEEHENEHDNECNSYDHSDDSIF